jgi:hypothetical protein
MINDDLKKLDYIEKLVDRAKSNIKSEVFGTKN